MRRRTFIKHTGMAGLITLASPSGMMRVMGKPKDNLESIFRQPPAAAYPQAFWFWMNGHVTKEGITKDLEAMKSVGIGGVFNYDAGTGIPKGPIEYLSPEWIELKKHAIREAGRLGLEFTLHNCPGWSSSGGPWITPELTMQQITWSETYVTGGRGLSRQLPKPFHKLNFYRDVAVLAFPALEGEEDLQHLKARTHNGVIPISKITGEDPKGVSLEPEAGSKTAWVQLEFKESYEARSITFLVATIQKKDAIVEQDFAGKRSVVLLQVSNNGLQFQTVATISTGLESELLMGDKFITYDIPPTKARYFRLTIDRARRISQVRLSRITRLNDFMEKAANRFMFSGEGISNLYTTAGQEVPATSVVNLDAVSDITAYMDATGFLNWEAPPGNWTILRFGYTPLGTLNKAAPDTGLGLECDKYSKTAMEWHFDKMLEHLLPDLKLLAAKGKAGLEIDSYEAGPQTWTPQFREAFRQRRQYDLLKYLPALTGRIAGSVATTESFLWDYRRTGADLMADNYYGHFRELCHRQGITTYIEPYDKGPFEEMQIGSRVDVNMGEFWYGLFATLQGNLPIRRTPKLAASIAHINGQRVVGAEAFTAEPASSRWQEYPFALKALGDLMFTQGINRMIFHRLVHQPHPTAQPGMTMGPWGIHFDRTTTWFKESKTYLQYLARCQGLLQQGHFVADLAYFTGEEASFFTRVNREDLHPAPPEGYDYDLVNAEVLLNKATIENGQLTLEGGMHYQVLVLQDFKALTLTLLRKLHQLVAQGLVMVGAPPLRPLGLKNSTTGDTEFKQLCQQLWGHIDGVSLTENCFGKGLVCWGQPLTNLLQKLKIEPDFEVASRSGDAPVVYIHRKAGDVDFYFISNQRRNFEETVCTFRIEDRQPELWDAVTGSIAPVPVYEQVEGRVRVPVQLAPYGSVFMVFRKGAAAKPFQAVVLNHQTFLGTHLFKNTYRQLYKDVADHFTIALWAKPEMNVMMQPSLHMEKVKHPYTDYYAIYPPPGKQLYGEGHATCGLAIGRNGVAVWEHGAEAPVLVLAVPVPISGWSHVALVYANGVPSISVDGKRIREGKKSNHVVHPGLGEAYRSESASYYNGDMGTPRLFKEVLSDKQIVQLAQEPSPLAPASPFVVEIAASRQPALRCWQNGTAQLQYPDGTTRSVAVTGLQPPVTLDGAWEVRFPPGLGAPDQIRLSKLLSLHRHPLSGVKYFSGTATYAKSFKNPYTRKAGQRVFLNLGRVEVIARVWLNGKGLGTLWSRPYQLDITDAVTAGINQLEIQVTNLWPNRLIGDEQLPDDNVYAWEAETGSFESLVGGGIEQMPQWYLQGKPQPDNGRIAFATWKHYSKESPLLESGLIGPVTLRTAMDIEV